MSELTHFDPAGEARMVDVGDKPVTRRIAVAEGWIRMLPETLALARAEIALESRPAESAVYCRATVETAGQTGVEMEALCAVSVSLLAIYDMCKAADRAMTIHGVRLLEKSGGKSGTWLRSPDDAPRT